MKEIANAIKQICEEKALEYDAVIETIESALAAAYRKDFGKKNQNIKVEFNDEDVLRSQIFDIKTVVEDLPEDEQIEDEEVEEPVEENRKRGAKREESEALAEPEDENERKFNPKTEIQLRDALLIKRDAKIGDEIRMELETPEAYGRMAAQTAKQVIIQKLREAEREMVFSEFKDKEGEVVNGVIQRREGRVILIDLGKSVGVLPADEQLPGENYKPGERIKVYVKEVALKPRGPEVVLSRTSDKILRKIFVLEIPEIANGLIELKAVAREAGARSKVAVWTDSENVDPIGSCVGQRGARIQTIISELGGEKVDIIEYDDDPKAFISNALSPAKILRVEIDEESRKAQVFVSEDQLSLAIGKGGQNARLAAKLTGWNVDIIKSGDSVKETKPKEESVDLADEENDGIEE
jgi:N utilization substance protein A